jgi:MtN3 and saliva related transmembrane protein
MPIFPAIRFLLIAVSAAMSVAVASPILASDRAHDDQNPLIAETIGLVAGLGTTFAAFPDLLAMLKNRSTKGMNPRMATIMGSFQTLWLIYGFMIDAPAVIIWNAIAVVINGTTVGAYYHFAQLQRKAARQKGECGEQ